MRLMLSFLLLFDFLTPVVRVTVCYGGNRWPMLAGRLNAASITGSP